MDDAVTLHANFQETTDDLLELMRPAQLPNRTGVLMVMAAIPAIICVAILTDGGGHATIAADILTDLGVLIPELLWFLGYLVQKSQWMRLNVQLPLYHSHLFCRLFAYKYLCPMSFLPYF